MHTTRFFIPNPLMVCDTPCFQTDFMAMFSVFCYVLVIVGHLEGCCGKKLTYDSKIICINDDKIHRSVGNFYDFVAKMSMVKGCSMAHG